MSNITALREKIADLAKTANHMLAEKGSQTWTKEEQASFDNIADEIERAQAQIFFVPAGNCADLMGATSTSRIVSVSTLEDAISSLDLLADPATEGLVKGCS